MVSTFEFYRFRFAFRALDPVHFPPGKSGNLIRGAFGMALRSSASASAYQHWFEPGPGPGRAPSGLADWPRPFVLRAAHLDGITVPAGSSFCFDVHVFDLKAPVLPHFRPAFAQLAESGLGPGRGRSELEAVQQLDADDRVSITGEAPGPPTVVSLDPVETSANRVLLRFLTPTELKGGGALVVEPEFPVLFGRLRDRIASLRTLYGAGAPDVDFRGQNQRAAEVRLVASRIEWQRRERKSARTGQVHPLGGFTGEAEYEGAMAEFLPWLRAARWVGVGRQTVWGKGDVRVVE
jgi:hypothetical protein